MIVGIAGLGRLGAIFADRLMANGQPVHVWNRSSAPREAALAKGATFAETPRALAEAVDVLLVSLADAEALEAVYGGDTGLLAADLAGVTIVETSTVEVTLIESLANRVYARGGAFLDAPVLGTLGPAREGRLVFTVGGEADVVERARPLLTTLGRKIVRMGPVGAGTTMKLVVNQCLCLMFASVGEALSMGETRGIDPMVAMDIILDSAFASPALASKCGAMLGQEADVAFDLAGGRKDLAAALAATDYPGPISKAGLATFDTALTEGWGDRDVGAIAAFRHKHG